MRDFVNGRDSDDPQGRQRAATAWRELVARELDRIRGYVVTFRFPSEPSVRIDPSDYDDAVQAAVERTLDALLRSFRGASVGEFRAAVRTCTGYACMDFCRARMREERGLAGSIDEERSTGEGTVGRFDHELAEVARRISEGRFYAAIDLHAVAAALDELENDNMRAVLRLTFEGRRSAEIAEELELSVANVDQLRSRGIRRLNEALRAHD